MDTPLFSPSSKAKLQNSEVYKLVLRKSHPRAFIQHADPLKTPTWNEHGMLTCLSPRTPGFHLLSG